MIGRIQGTLISINAPKLLIDCNGLGYEVDVPMSTLYQLPPIGQKLTLLIHFHVREDLQQLFGFATDAERDAFRSLIKISGFIHISFLLTPFLIFIYLEVAFDI